MRHKYLPAGYRLPPGDWFGEYATQKQRKYLKRQRRRARRRIKQEGEEFGEPEEEKGKKPSKPFTTT